VVSLPIVYYWIFDFGPNGQELSKAEYRTILKLRDKVLGSEHPDTLKTCSNLAACLRSEGQTQEATTFAQRAADGARKVLGPEHPDTKKYEQLLQELLAKAG
jgi:Tetratricopeptide repeat